MKLKYLEYDHHVARLRRRRRRRRAYAPTSNTASHDNHEKINSWVSFCFPYEYGASLGGPRSLAIVWRMAAISRDSVVAVAAVVRTLPRAIPLAMITMRKSSFLQFSIWEWGSAWRPYYSIIHLFNLNILLS